MSSSRVVTFEQFYNSCQIGGAAALETVNIYLAQDNATVNRPDTTGMTALMGAIIRDDLEIVNALLAKPGIDYNFAAPKGMTALMCAIFGNVAIVRALLEKNGIEINAADSEGNTALIYAVYRGSMDIVTALLDRMSPNELLRENKEGLNAQQVAEQEGHAAIARVIRAYIRAGREKPASEVDESLTPPTMRPEISSGHCIAL
jgi:ankyrin repeat protein